MCGLVSVITKTSNGFTKEQCDVFDSLLFMDQLRGMHSTGTFLVDKENQMQWIKEACNATDFRQYKVYHEHLEVAYKRGSALVGHNRHATKGEVVDENAHPFTVDNRITLVHNGTLWGDHKKLADTVVDSHAIAHVIHENGDDVEAALSKLSGAYALIWHDYKNSTVNFVRNSQRPLYWIETHNSWIWASEANMLNWVADKFNLRPIAPPQQLATDVLCIYRLTNGQWELSNKPLNLVIPTYQTENRTYTSYLGEDNWYNGKQRGYYPYNNDATNNHTVDNFPTVVTSNPLEVVDRVDHSRNDINARIKSIEESLILQNNSTITWAKHTAVSDSFELNQMYLVNFVEVTEVSVSNPTLGTFLYGYLEEEPGILVKMHMGPIVPDSTLLDYVVNARSGLVNLSQKEWKQFSKEAGVATGQGYSLFTGTFIRQTTPLDLVTN